MNIEIEPRRIDQTVLGTGGNCNAACLAMLLGLELAEVPNFAATHDDDTWFYAQRAWLNARGWNIVCVPYAPGFMFGFWLAAGPSERGLHHVCVYLDEQLWHDPHPARSGLIKIEEADLIMPLRPFYISEELRDPSLPLRRARTILREWLRFSDGAECGHPYQATADYLATHPSHESLG